MVMEFVEFYERIEATEDPTDGHKNDKAQDTSKGKKAKDKPKNKRNFNKDNKGNGKFCFVHGPRHDSNKCKLLGAKAKHLKRAFEEKSNNKPHKNTNKKKSTWRKCIEEGNFLQDEINATTEHVVALKKTDKKKERPTKEVDDLTNFNYEDLEALDISNSENSSDNEWRKNLLVVAISLIA